MPRNIEETAAQVFSQIREIQSACDAAKTALGSDYGTLVAVPGRIKRLFTLVTELVSETPPITADILGPVAASQFHHDPAKTWQNHYSVQYTAFKSAATALLVYLMPLTLSHTFDSVSGIRLYNVDPGVQIRTDLAALLEAVISCDFE